MNRIFLDHFAFSGTRQKRSSLGGIERWWQKHVQLILKRYGPETITHLCPRDGMERAQFPMMKCLPYDVDRWWPIRATPTPGTDRDIFHSSYFRIPTGPLRSICTVQDTVMMMHGGLKGFAHRWMEARAIRRSSLVQCPSLSTKRMLSDEMPDIASRIRVVRYGIDIPEATEKPPQLSQGPEFLLFVGKRGGYKNGALALRAFASGFKDFRLVLVGGEDLSRSEQEVLGKRLDCVVHLRGIPDAQLAWLYAHAACLWYLSTMEGFGFPPLEAAMQHCPVVAMSGHSVEEMCGEYCAYIRTSDIDALSAATAKAMGAGRFERGAIAQRLKERYTWEAYADGISAVYEELLR